MANESYFPFSYSLTIHRMQAYDKYFLLPIAFRAFSGIYQRIGSSGLLIELFRNLQIVMSRHFDIMAHPVANYISRIFLGLVCFTIPTQNLTPIGPPLKSGSFANHSKIPPQIGTTDGTLRNNQIFVFRGCGKSLQQYAVWFRSNRNNTAAIRFFPLLSPIGVSPSL